MWFYHAPAAHMHLVQALRRSRIEPNQSADERVTYMGNGDGHYVAHGGLDMRSAWHFFQLPLQRQGRALQCRKDIGKPGLAVIAVP